MWVTAFLKFNTCSTIFILPNGPLTMIFLKSIPDLYWKYLEASAGLLHNKLHRYCLMFSALLTKCQAD